MNKQLKEKDGNAFKDVFPINIIQNIKDGDTGKTLQSILKSFNSIFVEYKNNVEDTRNSIDESIRRKGLWVTYLPTGEQDYVTEVYVGNEESIINNWADNSNWKKILNVDYNSTVEGKIPNGIITMEKLSPALQELLKQNNNIINYPDDEDLQADYGYLQFKDRKYNPDLASGKGYKILRKNWLGVNNILTQDMINEENTIYVIRYDFDLNGKEITIPEGCVLDFEGGSLSNGILNGNNTNIKYDYTIFYNIIIKGSWIVPIIYSYMFNDIENDNLYNLLALQNEYIYNTIYIEGEKEYIVTPRNNTGLIINSNCTININAIIKVKVSDNSKFTFLLQTWKKDININNKVRNVIIKGSGTLIGNFNKNMINYNSSSGGVRLFYCENSIIDGITIKNSQGDAVTVSIGCNNIVVKNVIVDNFARNGYAIVDGLHTIISNCSAYNGGYTDPYAAIDIEPNLSNSEHTYIENNVLIENFTAINCGRAFCSYCPQSSFIHSINYNNIFIKDCGKELIDIINKKQFYGDIFSLTLKNTNININNININNINNINGGKKGLGAIINANNININNAYIDCLNFTGLKILNTKHTSIDNSYIKVKDYIFLPGSNNVNINNSSIYSEYLFHTNDYEEDKYTTNIIVKNNNLNTRIIGIYVNSIFENNIITINDSKNNLAYIIGNTNYTMVDNPPMFKNNIIRYKGDIKLNTAVNINIEGISFIKNKLQVNNVDKGITINNNIKNAYILDNIITGSTYKIFNYSNLVAANYSYLKGNEKPKFTLHDIQAEGFFMYDTDKKCIIIWNGEKWNDINGNVLNSLKQGTTQQRPTGVKAGFYYFDTTLNKPIWKKEDTGTIWVDATGAEV